MNRCDFSSISTCLKNHISESNTKNQKLLAGGALSPIVLDYIMDSEVPKPCRHFIGRDKELEELYTMLEENRHVFLYGIAGIGKSELAKAYAKRYMRHYTNILYVEKRENQYFESHPAYKIESAAYHCYGRN